MIMIMKNADMPANPCEFDHDKDSKGVEQYLGITKREMFAMHAPECPESFIFKFATENNSKRSFFSMYKSGEVFLFSVTGHCACIKAWRYHYADMMLGVDDVG